MVIPNGRFLKEKGEYFKEALTTREGVFDFFVGSAIWGFLIVTYTKVIFGTFLGFFAFITIEPLQYYLAYLSYGALLIPISFGISWLNMQVFKVLKRLRKEFWR